MKPCVDCQTPFTSTESDLAFYQKMDVPEPTQCPNCRFMRRLNERNPRTLYTRSCDHSGKSIISQHPADAPFPVYEAEHWWRGDWDGLQYGRDYDASRPFFEQVLELKHTCPHPALTVIPATLENSDFNNCVGYLKNCYLIAESDYNEDCYYSNLLKQCKDVCDSSVCYEDELCYECVDCVKCYNLLFSQDCTSCKDSYFLRDCESCTDCIGCSNQKQQQYMIFNKQYTKEEYETKKAEMALNTREGIERVRAQAAEFFATEPRRHAVASGNENANGNHLYNSKNADHCFDSKDLEDCVYCAKLSLSVKSSQDFNSWGDRAELIYFSTVCGDGVYNLRFCTNSFTNLKDCTYADICVNSSNLFGCVGLRNKQYCILNKQYTKEEYETLVPRIVAQMKESGEWGEFFPKQHAPYGYNETLAQEVFPLARDEAIARGYRWQDALPKITDKGTVPADQVPATDDAIDVDALAGQILTCTDCQSNYKLIVHELALYKQIHVPVPTKCPNCRHRDRMSLRLPLQLWTRQCNCAVGGHDWHAVDTGSPAPHDTWGKPAAANCPNSFETSYHPDRPETVYCEPCYEAEYVA